MPNGINYQPFRTARSLIEQTAGGMQMYQRYAGQLGRQFGLQQRRGAMQARALGLPPHLQFAAQQGMYPQLYGQYAGGLAQAAAAAPGIDIRKAQALGGIQTQIGQLQMAQRQMELQEKMYKESQRTSFWDVLGMVGGLGLGVAGLMFPPAGLGMAAGGMGLGAMQGGQQGGGQRMPIQGMPYGTMSYGSW